MPINKDVIIGKRTKIFQPDLINLYDCKIGEDCSVGAHVTIQKGVVIGNKVKILDGAFIPEGVTIEDEVFIGPHVCFTNDRFPRASNLNGDLKGSDDWILTSTLIQRKASIGANATIICGVTIHEEAMVGAGSVVTKDVPARTLVVGNPAKIIRKIIK